MKKLLRKLNTGEFKDNGWLSVQKTIWLDEDAVLVVTLNDGVQNNQDTNWKIEAKSVLEYWITDAYGDSLNHYENNHVILKQYTDKTANLSFRGTHASSELVVGALAEAHFECVQNWISFNRYMNMEQKLSELLSGGFGKLADGPLFLLKEYERVLARFDIQANITDARPAKRWNGLSWVELTSPPEMIHLGGTYIVASAFQATEQT